MSTLWSGHHVQIRRTRLTVNKLTGGRFGYMSEFACVYFVRKLDQYLDYQYETNFIKAASSSSFAKFASAVFCVTSSDIINCHKTSLQQARRFVVRHYIQPTKKSWHKSKETSSNKLLRNTRCYEEILRQLKSILSGHLQIILQALLSALQKAFWKTHNCLTQVYAMSQRLFTNIIDCRANSVWSLIVVISKRNGPSGLKHISIGNYRDYQLFVPTFCKQIFNKIKMIYSFTLKKTVFSRCLMVINHKWRAIFNISDILTREDRMFVACISKHSKSCTKSSTKKHAVHIRKGQPKKWKSMT